MPFILSIGGVLDDITGLTVIQAQVTSIDGIVILSPSPHHTHSNLHLYTISVNVILLWRWHIVCMMYVQCRPSVIIVHICIPINSCVNIVNCFICFFLLAVCLFSESTFRLVFCKIIAG